jgi:hypothetical protein
MLALIRMLKDVSRRAQTFWLFLLIIADVLRCNKGHTLELLLLLLLLLLHTQVTFPDRRLAYVALGSGSRVTTSAASVKRCANSMVFSRSNGFSTSARFQASGVAPMAPNTNWQVNVVSATGSCGAFMVASASIPIAKC